MIGILQPFHLLVIALAAWLSRHHQTVIDDLIEENRVLKAADSIDIWDRSHRVLDTKVGSRGQAVTPSRYHKANVDMVLADGDLEVHNQHWVFSQPFVSEKRVRVGRLAA